MATSDDTLDLVENRQTDRSLFSTLSRHDLVLAVIPSVFVVAILVGQVLALSAQTSIGIASLVGVLAVVDALFVNPPSAGGS